MKRSAVFPVSLSVLSAVLMFLLAVFSVCPVSADVLWNPEEFNASQSFIEEHEAEIVPYDGCLSSVTEYRMKTDENGKKQIIAMEGPVEVRDLPDSREAVHEKNVEWLRNVNPDVMYIDEQQNIWVHISGYYRGRNNCWVCASNITERLTEKVLTEEEAAQYINETKETDAPGNPAGDDSGSSIRSIVVLFVLLLTAAGGAFILIRILKKRQQD